MAAPPEVWLRGPIPGVPESVQPVAHALLQSLEDVAAAAAGLPTAQLWLQPGGAASVGFHLLHLAGSTDRLFTYARGEALTDEQRQQLERERAPQPASSDALVAAYRGVIEGAVVQLRRTPPGTLPRRRAVGRARLPSTVRGLLFHAAEHAQRHTGQVVTTARIVRGLGLGG